MKLGTLQEIWRYPVKSMGGEAVTSAFLKPRGLAGDRCWSILDGETGEIRSAKRWPGLLNFRATLCAGEDIPDSGYDADVPDVQVHCPDGVIVRGRDAAAAQQISTQLKKAVRLAPLVHPKNRDHYRPAKPRTWESIERDMDLLPGEALPESLSSQDEVIAAVSQFVTPPGTYVDAYPVHLLTTNALDYLSHRGGVDAVLQRFRPNLLIEPTEQLPQMTENGWLDYRMQLGEVRLHIHSRTLRCSMPARGQAWCDLAEQPAIGRAMRDLCERYMGVNVLVETAGRVSVGDELVLLN
jgi:uncharacterized protein YcbX